MFGLDFVFVVWGAEVAFVIDCCVVVWCVVLVFWFSWISCRFVVVSMWVVWWFEILLCGLCYCGWCNMISFGFL